MAITAGALVLVLVAQTASAAVEAAPIGAKVADTAIAGVPAQGVHAIGIRSVITPTVTVTTSKSEALAGQTFRVTATSSIAATTTDPITLIDFTSGTLLKTCTYGTTCYVNTSFISTEPNGYIARHGETETSPVSVTPTPWTLTVTTSRETISAGQNVNVDLVTSQNPYTVRSVWGVRVVEVATGTVISECPSTTTVTGGYRCRVTVPWFADPSRQYRGELYDKATGEVLASSNEAIVTSQPFVLSVSVGSAQVPPDGSTTLTVHSNQQTYSIRTQYIVHIIDASTEAVVQTCISLTSVSGDYTCTVTVSAAPGSDEQFYAVVAPPGSPGSNRLATSNVASISVGDWVVRLEVDKPVVSVEEYFSLDAYINGLAGDATPPARLYILDSDTGEFVGPCGLQYQAGTGEYRCRKDMHADPEVRTHHYVAVVASPTDPTVDVAATSNTITVTAMPWQIFWQYAQLDILPGDTATFHAQSTQSVYETDGNYAIYIKDVTTGEILDTCLGSPYEQDTQTRCTDGIHFNEALVPQSIQAFVAPANDPNGVRLAETDIITVSRVKVEAYLGRGYSNKCGTENASVAFVGDTDYNVDGSSYRPVLHTPDGVGTTYSYGYGWKLFDPHHACDAYGMYYYTVEGFRDGMTDTIAMSNVVFYPSGYGAYELAGGGNPAEECAQSCTGDPVNTATGEFYENTTDLSLPGVGPSLVWSRGYSSRRATIDDGLGFGWSTNAQMTITPVIGADLASATYVLITQENGSYVPFAVAPTGEWIAPPRVFAELVSNPDGTFTFTRRGTDVFTFSAAGVLTAASDLNGNSVSLEYDQAGLLSRMVADDGRWIAVTRAAGRVSSVADSTGRSVAYSYDALGNLLTVAGSGGNSETYTYDSSHRVTALTPPASGTTTNQYDSTGRVVRQVAPDGGVTVIAYSGTTTTITQPDGSRILESFVEGRLASRTVGYGTPLAATTSFTYTARSQVASTTDPAGRTTTLIYDQAGNVRQMVAANGAITTYDYDADNNLLQVRNALGAEVSFTYDEHGNVISATDAMGSTSTYAYDAQGRRVSTTDPYGHSSSVAYDEFSNPEISISPTGVKSAVEADALGRVTRTWDPRAWLPGADPSDFDSTLTYGALGLLTSVTDPTGASATISYDAGGRAVASTDALGRESTVQYDSSGRPTVLTDVAGRTTTYTYDLMSRVLTVARTGSGTTAATYDILGRTLTTTDAEGGVTSYTYNVIDQVVTTADPDGRVWTNVYDALGRLTATVDPTGAQTNVTSDSLGRVTQVTDPLGRATTYQYDAAGRVTQVQLPDDSVETTTYDALGRVVSSTDTSGRTATAEYDAEGRVVESVDILGRESTAAYEAGYLIASTGPDGVASTYEYDTRGYLVGSSTGSDHTVSLTIDAAGRVTSSLEPAGATTYAYDALDRVTGVSGPTGDVGYGYDAAGNVSSVTYPSGRVVTRDHDLLGRLTEVSSSGVGDIGYSWTAGSLLSSISFPNGVTSDFGFDGAGRLDSIAVAGPGGSILGIDYTLGADGRLTSRSTTRGAGSAVAEAFASDALGRVSPSVNGAMSASFTPSHEVTVLPDGTTLTYSATGVPEVVATQGVSTAIASDAAGNRTGESIAGVSVANYTWNDLGQLTAVSDTRPGVDVSYGYASGLRTSATGTNAGGTVDDAYVWDISSGIPLLLSDGTYEYIYGTGTAPIAQVDVATGEVLFLHGDSIGSTRSVTDALGAVVAEFDYSLYGTVATVSGDAGATRFLFAGEYLDPSGDYYLRNRVYDPASASFLSVDPALAATGMPYAYTPGNPLQAVDPLGLNWLSDTLTSPAFWAGTAVFIGCELATGGTGSVLCLAGAGAVASAVDYVETTPAECQTLTGYFTHTLIGAGVGVLGGRLFGPALSKVFGAGGRSLLRIAPTFIRKSLGSVAEAASARLTAFTEAVQQRTGNLFAQARAALADDTGSIQIGRTARSGASPVSQVTANKIAGDAFRDQVAGRLESEMGFSIIGTEVRVKTPFGPRIIDILAEKNGGLVNFETKLGSSRYLTAQRAKDWWIANVGVDVLGNGTATAFPSVVIRGPLP